MKLFTWVFVALHLIITILWIANSPVLFSIAGVVAWLLLIAGGFGLYFKTKQMAVIVSSFFMVFLLLLTGLIEWTVSSMP
ncbi:hypothetical protein [Rossellomorea marisflavi]|uniref:hypothetical protein n=1 Tax=Rossellomorea marisflavi TaxID=189381 RepID=UPI0006FFDECF|nr:hypothetical protein ASG66_03300 [Bacillus sp. Leaf406]